jgi:transglutaminase-like putative cysteine protease
MPQFKITHLTKYNYEVPVRDSANQIILFPLRDEYQEVIQHHITVTGDVPIEIHTDYFENKVGTFTQSKSHQSLSIDSRLVVVTHPKELPQDKTPAENQWKELAKLKTQMQFIDFLRQESFDGISEVNEAVDTVRSDNKSPYASTLALCSFVYDHFKYKKGITTVESTLDEIWKIKTGVCQDFAHVLLAMLRLMDIPARYVSGYICTKESGMRGEGATHAWVEAYIPFYGWLGFDPTNNCIVNGNHVRLAVGRNFSDCSPVKGTYRGTSEHTLEVIVSVSHEDGHVTEDSNEVIESELINPASRNSYRRHQEIQMQQ